MKDIVAMNNGPVLVNVHTAAECAGQWCCIHNPSNHHMALWPHHWDSFFKQMWRECPHEMHHPDPDDLTYTRSGNDPGAVALWLHNCDGCCQPPKTLRMPKEIEQQIGDFLDDPDTGTVRGRDWKSVQHEPDWRPAMLQYNAAGDKRPGFECAHELENGAGLCGANVFTLDQAHGTHSCIVNKGQPGWT